MKLQQARLTGILLNPKTKRFSFSIEAPLSTAQQENLEQLQDKELDVTVDKHRKRRSLDANGLLWHCLDEIAKNIPGADKWKIYLLMLRRYGKFTYICVKPDVVDAVKQQWRECEEIGEININGTKAVQLLCYFGSSTYDTKEFSRLLDGVISEMSDMGLETPTSEDMRRALEQLEKMTKRRESNETEKGE